MNWKQTSILIFMIIAGFAGLFAQSENPGWNGLREGFRIDSLGPSELKAFERRAAEKLHDLADFISIAGTATYDAEMREKAAGMAVELFVSESSPIVAILPNKEKPGHMPVGEYFAQIQKASTWSYLKVEVQKTRYTKTPVPDGEGGYKGLLEATLSVVFDPGKPSAEKWKYQGQVTFVLAKVPKAFGARKDMVWEAMLGEFERSED